MPEERVCVCVCQKQEGVRAPEERECVRVGEILDAFEISITSSAHSTMQKEHVWPILAHQHRATQAWGVEIQLL